MGWGGERGEEEGGGGGGGGGAKHQITADRSQTNGLSSSNLSHAVFFPPPYPHPSPLNNLIKRTF